MFKYQIVWVVILVSACTHKPMSFIEIVIDHNGYLLPEEVASKISELVESYGLSRLGLDGYSEITKKSGPIDFSSKRFVVSIVATSDNQIVVGLYEESADLTQLGLEFVDKLVATIQEQLSEGVQVRLDKKFPNSNN